MSHNSSSSPLVSVGAADGGVGDLRLPLDLLPLSLTVPVVAVVVGCGGVLLGAIHLSRLLLLLVAMVATVVVVFFSLPPTSPQPSLSLSPGSHCWRWRWQRWWWW